MKPAELDTYPVARVEGLAARVAALEAENKDLRDRFSDADTERNAAQAALKAAFARVAELEARCKRAENDAGWAFSMGAVVHRDEGDWYAVCEGECGSNPSLFSAISELRSHVEAKP
jgi:hypothetical protein